MNRKPRRVKNRCRVTGSIRYSDEIAAKLALASIQNNGPRRGQPDMIRTFECKGGCGGYHVTPSAQRNSHSG